MAIIIPSKSIYNLENQKVVDNKINGVEYEENHIVQNDETAFSYSVQPYDDDMVLNSELTTIYKSISGTMYYYGVRTIIIETDIGFSSIYGYNYSYTNQNGINNSTDFNVAVDRELQNNDTLITGAYLYIYDNIISVSKHSITLYFMIQNYNSSTQNMEFIKYATIVARGISYFQTNTMLNVGNSSKISLQTNELMQNTTKNGNMTIGTYLASQIITSYANGKKLQLLDVASTTIITKITLLQSRLRILQKI